jgi:hypothetical protein
VRFMLVSIKYHILALLKVGCRFHVSVIKLGVLLFRRKWNLKRFAHVVNNRNAIILT